MNEIEPRSRLALELARTDAEPSVADKLRNLQALQARLGTPPVIPTSTGERGAPQSPVAASGASGAAGLGKLIAVGGVMALLGLGAGLSLRGAPTTASAPQAASAAAAPRALASVDTAAATETSTPVAASLPLVPAVEPSPAAGPASTVTSPTSSKPASVRARPATAVKDELFQALELLRRSQRALRKREPALSLALLDELDARFAPNMLGEERRATLVLALCLSGDQSGATKVARALLAQNPATIYAGRVRESCAGSER